MGTLRTRIVKGGPPAHFITTSCYQRRALLGQNQNRDLFLEVMEQVRKRYHFVVVGYVVMPEHVHLLLGEPERGNPSVVLQATKQGFSGSLSRGGAKGEPAHHPRSRAVPFAGGAFCRPYIPPPFRFDPLRGSPYT